MELKPKNETKFCFELISKLWTQDADADDDDDDDRGHQHNK